MWKDGKVSLLLHGEMPNLNGLAFSPNETYLYLNGSADNYVNRYEVKPDDTIATGKLFLDMRQDKRPGAADGMRVDSVGNVYETGPGGVWIVSPEGKHLGTIATPQRPINIGFGGRGYQNPLHGFTHSRVQDPTKGPGPVDELTSELRAQRTEGIAVSLLRPFERLMLQTSRLDHSPSQPAHHHFL
jgi:hypothetical protein